MRLNRLSLASAVSALLAGHAAAERPAARAADGPLAELRCGMALERAFSAAGGLLIAGRDPTGNGGTVPGLSNQRAPEPIDAVRGRHGQY